MTSSFSSKLIKCESCSYEWDFKPSKRPDPRKATCPNCDKPVILRPSKLEAKWNKDEGKYEVSNS